MWRVPGWPGAPPQRPNPALRGRCAGGRIMLNDLRQRLRFWNRPAALPAALLLLALATLFLFGHDRAYFYREDLHDWNSAKVMALAENLSFQHNLLRFYYLSQDADGSAVYPETYNRFPPGGYALIKLVILPFGDTDFTGKIYAARMLMLTLCSGAVLLAYHSLARITGSRWDALAATVLAFSSWYVLYNADQISNEVMVDLFAVMLAFHGMVIFIQERRFGQLAVKSCLALLLGWHAYAFLLPFVVFGLSAELFQAHHSVSNYAALWDRWQGYMLTLRRSRYMMLGIVTLLFGIAVLAFNIGSQYFALDGQVSLRELPAVQSALRRFGGDEQYNIRFADRLEPGVFTMEQFYRIAVMALPHAVNPYEIKVRYPDYYLRDYPAITLGVLAVGVCAAGLAGIRRRPGMLLALATLASSGFCWALLVRHNVFDHDYESIFYIGIPLVAFTVAARYLRQLCRVRLTPFLAVAALAVFAVSVSQMAGIGENRDDIAVEAEQMAEYAAVRELAAADSATIYAQWDTGSIRHGGAPWAWAYLLAGKTIVDPEQPEPRRPKQAGDYLLTVTREDNPALLTPEHRYVFLYDWTLYEEWLRTADRGAPIINGDWQVYLRDGHLTYVSPECARRDARFFLHIVPMDQSDLIAGRQKYGYNGYDFDFKLDGGLRWDGGCVIERPLPGYNIAELRTGQYSADVRLWEENYPLPAASP